MPEPSAVPAAGPGRSCPGHAWIGLHLVEDEPGFRLQAADPWLALHLRLDRGGSVGLVYALDPPTSTALPFRPGACAWVPPGTALNWRIAAGLRRMVIRLAPDLFELLAAEGAGPLPTIGIREPSHDPAMEHYAGLLHLELQRGASNQTYLEGIARLIGMHVLRSASEFGASPQGTRAAGLSAEQQDQIARYVARTLPEPIVMAELAAVLGLSHYQLLRRVKHSTGETPQAFVQRLRIDLARKLLRASDASLTDIAMTLGYSSPSHFSQAFRTHVRVSPRIYRERIDLD